MNPYKYLGLILLLIAIVAGSYIKGGWDKSNDLTAQYQSESIAQAAQTTAANTARNNAIAELDKKHTKERFDAEETIDNLLDDVGTGKRRLFIKTVKAKCPVPDNSNPSSLDYASNRAELDQGTAERIIGLTSRGDKAIRQLSACQDYVRAVNNTAISLDRVK